MITLLVEVNENAAVFLTIIAILLVIGLSFLIFLSVKKESKRYHEEVANYIDGVSSKNEIIADINAYISRSISAQFTLILINVDKFTSIVETFGKSEAEDIVKGMANKLLSILPIRVALGRLNVDEFLVFARGEFKHEEMVSLAKKIVETVSSPVKMFDEANINMTASVSVCYYPGHGRNYKQLSESLQIAMYLCKRDGGNQFKVYSREAGETEVANMDYYYQIKNGIRNKEFDIYYQPMIDGETKQIYALEGLLRWNHPELGLLPPFKFISIMEQTGDINWVGLWGLETIIKEFIEIKKTFDQKNLRMSLNLSPKQLSNPSLASDFQKVIKKYRVSAQCIILELEEYAIFEKHEQIKQNIKMLSELGFSIAVDGFGLDYKALKKLEDATIDIVKLDKEYLSDESDQTLKDKFINILVDFSKNQNKTLVAEGIENADYVERANKMGLSIYQGYYFAKPMSSDDLKVYLQERSWESKINN